MKRLQLTVLFLLTFIFSQAQLLWKVSGNGLKEKSYIFGTHHLIPLSFLDSIPGLYKSFNACNAVVGEVVINSIEATSKIKQASIMPDHKTIKDFLDSTKYHIVDNELNKTLKIGLNELSRLHPSLILSLYEIELFRRVTKIYDDAQSDSYFQIAANEKGKKVYGLETIDKQIELLFDTKDLQSQANQLYETIQNKDSVSNEMITLNKLYKKGNLDKLFLFSKNTDNKISISDEKMAELLDKRNEAWITQLPDLMSKSSCFIAVGALHLPGKTGLIEKLRALGYKVNAAN